MGKARNDVLCVKYSLTGEDQRTHAVDLRIRSRNQTVDTSCCHHNYI